MRGALSEVGLKWVEDTNRKDRLDFWPETRVRSARSSSLQVAGVPAAGYPTFFTVSQMCVNPSLSQTASRAANLGRACPRHATPCARPPAAAPSKTGRPRHSTPPPTFSSTSCANGRHQAGFLTKLWAPRWEMCGPCVCMKGAVCWL